MAVANSINSGQLLSSSSSPTFTGLNLSGLTISLGVFTDGSNNLSSTGTLGFSQGGFGFSTATKGDLFFASATNTPGKIADVAIGQVLVSGGVGGNPAWSASPTLTTSLTLPNANALLLTSVQNNTLTISSTTGVANTADIALNRFDSTNGNCRLIYKTGGTNAWSVGLRGGSQNYVILDETNVVSQLIMAQGSGTTGVSTFAGQVVISGLGGVNALVATNASKQLTTTVSGLSPTFTALTLSTGDLTLTTGSVVLSNFTASSGVFTDASKKLTTTGTLGVAQGGTGTGTAFTLGSMVFAGASGVYTQDNANAFYDATNHNMYFGCNTGTTLAVTGRLNILGAVNGIGSSAAWFSSADQYPLIQNTTYAHDNVHICFDSYFDGTNWRSSTTANNFQISKVSGDMYIHYAAAVNAGTIISWANSVVFDHLGNFGIGALPSAGGGTPVMFVLNANTVPTTNPSGGGILYAQAGAGKWRGSGGTVTTFGPADPHCPVCESDFGLEWANEKYGGTLRVCMKCFSEDMGNKPYIRWNEK